MHLLLTTSSDHTSKRVKHAALALFCEGFSCKMKERDEELICLDHKHPAKTRIIRNESFLRRQRPDTVFPGTRA